MQSTQTARCRRRADLVLESSGLGAGQGWILRRVNDRSARTSLYLLSAACLAASFASSGIHIHIRVPFTAWSALDEFSRVRDSGDIRRTYLLIKLLDLVSRINVWMAGIVVA